MRAAIIGGGITGLVLANELLERGNQVLLFESEEKLGGLTRSFCKPNWQWPLEEFFHHFFTSDSEVKDLLRQLDLKDKLFYRQAKTSVYYQGSIYQFDQPISILKFPHLSWTDKLRMGGTIFILRLMPFLSLFNRFSVAEFFPGLIGSSSWQTVWQPLFEGKFGSSADEVSFSWLWARLKKRSSKLGYLEGGCQKLITALEKEVKRKKGKIFLRNPVLGVVLDKNGWQIKVKRRKYRADKIVLTTPLPKAIELVKDYLPKEKLSLWQKLKMIGALVLVLRLKRRFLPGDTYWLNILEKDFPFVALIEHTNFIDSARYGGENLVYVGGYYHQDDLIFNWSKERVLKHFAPYLRRINPSFEKFLVGSDLFSSLYAQPIIPKNYGRIIPPVEFLPEKAYWITTNHIYPWDRGINFAIKMARKTAKLV